MPIDEIVFAVSCSATVTDEFELQLTKTGDKARNWMTMFQNWSTKDEIEKSIRTFQNVRDEIENTFSKIEWRDDENGPGKPIDEGLYARYLEWICHIEKNPMHVHDVQIIIVVTLWHFKSFSAIYLFRKNNSILLS